MIAGLFQRCTQVVLPPPPGLRGGRHTVQEFCHTDWTAIAIVVAAVIILVAAIIVSRSRRSR